jgi:hypothetical protein
VRETLGALVARWQSFYASSPAVRALYARIAEDELRHAALAWKVAAWAETRLPRQSRARVRAARQTAIAELQAELEVAPSPELVKLAGLPDAGRARALCQHLKGSIWT